MFSGAFTAIVTPFKENGGVDFDALGRFIDWQVAEGIDGLVPCGTTGESATLSHGEHKQVIRYTVERAGGRIKVFGGSGSNNTQEAIELTACCKEAGCDAALIITPYYNKPTQAGHLAHYRAIAEAVDIPIILYNVPGRTATKLEPATIAALRREVRNIVSIKEACGSIDQVTQILGLCDINVLSGDDSLTLPMAAVGARGVISVASNVAPGRVARLCRAANAGDYAAARALHFELADLFNAMFIETNPLPVKAALAMMGRIENRLRLPLTPMSAEGQARLEAVLRKTGVL